MLTWEKGSEVCGVEVDRNILTKYESESDYKGNQDNFEILRNW